jgi:hypothetical protein
VLLQQDARFGASLVLCDKLVRAPRAGNAWHADHVQAVYAGGGQCEIDNVRVTAYLLLYLHACIVVCISQLPPVADNAYIMSAYAMQ